MLSSTLLTKLMTFTRKSSLEADRTETGDIKKSEDTTIASNVPIRITNNEVYNKSNLEVNTNHKTSDFLGFVNVGDDVKMNDIGTDEVTGDKYFVVWVDYSPGGALDHHYEIYMNATRGE